MKRVLVIYITFTLLLFSFPNGVFALDSDLTNFEYSNRNLDEELADLLLRKEVLGEEISRLKQEEGLGEFDKRELIQEINIKKSSIDRSELEIQKKELELDKILAEIIALKKEVKILGKEKEMRQGDFRERVRNIGNDRLGGIFGSLINVKGISELINKIFTYKVVMEKDKEIIDNFIYIVNNLEKLEDELRIKLGLLEGRIDDLVIIKEEVEEDKLRLEYLLRKKDLEIEGFREMYNDLTIDLHKISEKEHLLRIEIEEEEKRQEEEKRKRELEEKKRKTLTSIGEGNFIYPVESGWLSSGYGSRWGTIHHGIDIAVTVGTNVYASKSGRVSFAGNGGGYGNLVMLEHEDGFETRYAHLSGILVDEGDYVEQGELIALSGNTGNSTGPHIHFEIREDGNSIDPETIVGTF